MGSTFNPQILIEKLAKLNSSAQSIETLSHWCIFHMHKAKQVVETWDRQFHCSPREQRLAFLYLANDILQNSRRKGSEFVSEFWKVLPDSLRDVTKNGDEYAKNSALRLISIWDERKVFGSRGQTLKEEFVPRSTRNGKATGIKLRPGAKNALEKIVSGYQVVYSNLTDEDAIIKKCRSAISYIEKVDKESVNTVDEIKEQHDVLRECIDQLSVVETSRANLVSLLREALSEQEYKLELVRNQLQEAQAQSEETDNILRHLTNNTIMTSAPPQTYHKNNEQSLPVMYAKQVSFAEQCGPGLDEDHKSKAAAVAAKLTASTSSAEMLSFLSSLASEGVIGNALKEDYPPEKRARLDNNNNHHQYLYAHTEPSQNNVHEELGINEQPPPPPNSPPPMAPLPPMQPYVVGPGPVPGPAQYTYGYGAIMQHQQGAYYGMNGGQYVAGPPPPPPGNVYQSYPTEGGFYNQASSLPMAPISRE